MQLVALPYLQVPAGEEDNPSRGRTFHDLVRSRTHNVPRLAFAWNGQRLGVSEDHATAVEQPHARTVTSNISIASPIATRMWSRSCWTARSDGRNACGQIKATLGLVNHLGTFGYVHTFGTLLTSISTHLTRPLRIQLGGKPIMGIVALPFRQSLQRAYPSIPTLGSPI